MRVRVREQAKGSEWEVGDNKDDKDDKEEEEEGRGKASTCCVRASLALVSASLNSSWEKDS